MPLPESPLKFLGANVLPINGPQVVNAVVVQTPAQADFRTTQQGYPSGLTDPSRFNPLAANITYMPSDYRSSDVHRWGDTWTILSKVENNLGLLELVASAVVILVLVGVIRPAIKAMGTVPMAGADVRNVRMNQLDAMESDMPERPQLSGPGASTDQIQISASEKQLNDARQLTRDNPAAVANIIKTWMNGEAAA